MRIPTNGHIDGERAAWNDAMFAAHPTPYTRGLSRRIELARVRTILGLAAVQPEDRVLEIGCEAGNLLAAVPPSRRLVGADISWRALEAARTRLDGRDVELVQLDAEQPLPFTRGDFDVILCSEMLEHTEQPAAVLRNIRALATPRTRIVLSVPIEAPKVRLKQLLHRIGLLRLLAGNVEPHQSEWHLHAFSPGMLDELVAGSFVTMERRRVWAAHYAVLLRTAG
jgi:2-polyprenyl-3-methyl-5-hydroxy-6-metoxy-1,4-benzoquinol methylase